MVPRRRAGPYGPPVGIAALPARQPVDIVRRNTRSGGGVTQVEAHITGTVWKIEVAVGDTIEEGDTVVILESMKMEMPVESEDEGTVSAILVEEGQAVSEGDPLVELE
jgi:acetyl-CoA carboxylase biotin carboxyl carrier protein